MLHKLMEKLNIDHISTHALHLLAKNQKKNHINISQDLLDRVNAEKFLKNIIIHSWINSNDVETKVQLLQSGEKIRLTKKCIYKSF